MKEMQLSEDYPAQQREIKSIRKDISTARGVIQDGLLRYIKKMLRARSKKQAEDMSMFSALEMYESKREIQDAYGYDFISEKEMDRLNGLWDARVEFVKANGQFEDRVSRMLVQAMNSVGDEYMELLSDFAALERRAEEDRLRIARENSNNDYERYIAGL